VGPYKRNLDKEIANMAGSDTNEPEMLSKYILLMLGLSLIQIQGCR
jgi:hypothetical protein